MVANPEKTLLSVNFTHAYEAWKLNIALDSGAEIVVLFGPSGCGKSTTLNCIAGLLKPNKGLIAVNGSTFFDSDRSINLPPQQRRIGYVFQSYALFPHLNVRQNILFGITHLSFAAQKQKVEWLVDLLHLDGLSERRPDNLSGGQMQRVAIARALATDPRLLLLDEPFSALERSLRAELASELKRLQSDLHIPIVFVTHATEEAALLADKIIMIDASGQSRQARLEELSVQDR